MAQGTTRFERYLPIGIVKAISREATMAGLKRTANQILQIMAVGAVATAIVMTLVLFIAGWGVLAPIVGVVSGAVFIIAVYMVIEYLIDGRKTKLEEMFPDYLQIASANLRSGIALDRAMLLAARPEFTFLSDDIKEMNRRIFSGETFEAALKDFASKYRSYELGHAVRMMLEALRYGGAMADLLEHISKDLRNQQLIQKEVAGQLFMYSIFIAFAGLIAAPVLYSLTSQMISVTDQVWKGILTANPGGLPTTGISFLKPSPPKISPGTYHTFSLISIAVITAFASMIMSAISTGSALKGLKYLPVFMIVGFGVFFIGQAFIGSLFSSLGGI
ncbi:MAG TPA: type II secretion system F family protein [Candidatus Acidoferrales bacterium]|nr:type II secretion system F family protein [Candidatus Acidoferrales bacterium]